MCRVGSHVDGGSEDTEREKASPEATSQLPLTSEQGILLFKAHFLTFI